MFPVLIFIRKKILSALAVCRDPWKRAYYVWCLRFVIFPRFTQRDMTLPDGTSLRIADIASFLSMYKSIYLDQIYDFAAPTSTPLILDCGANIGLSVLYFKRLYPRAHIIAIEADPQIATLLRQNIKRAGLRQVKVIAGAVWTKDTTLSFRSDHADGGSVIPLDSVHSPVMVNAFDFRAYVQGLAPITFLKMDIEGAEVDVVPHALRSLLSIPFVFIEYHSFPGKKQRLGAILNSFEQAGYRLELQDELSSKSPFRNRSERAGMDYQVNIFAHKYVQSIPMRKKYEKSD